MKKVSRIADGILDRMVTKTTASAQMQTQWIECNFNVFCAVVGKREKMSCRVVGEQRGPVWKARAAADVFSGSLIPGEGALSQPPCHADRVVGFNERVSAAKFPYADLGEFISALERDGDLKRITAPVDPTLEISEITQRVVRDKGPALLFENPTRGQMPVAINLSGHPNGWRRPWAPPRSTTSETAYRNWSSWKFPWDSRVSAKASQAHAVEVGSAQEGEQAPCQQVVYKGDQVDLNRLPGLQTWPVTAASSTTSAPLTHTKHPRAANATWAFTGFSNTTVARWACTGRSTRTRPLITRVAERRGERLPVAVAIGADPIVAYSGGAPLPAEIDEYLFAGYLRGERVEMVDCLTVPLQVPANAQIILEGYIEPGERKPEGPFGDHTGFYTPVEPFPVMHVECMTTRKNPIYHSIVTSRPPQEDYGMGKATERIFLPLLKILIPDIVDYNMPEAGGVPQLSHRVHRQAVPEARSEGHERVWGAQCSAWPSCW